jgi:diguanylate cyclase (GGDEF)-like protein/PAS domain S-box-containing protein
MGAPRERRPTPAAAQASVTSSTLLRELGAEVVGRALGLIDAALVVLDAELRVVQVNDRAELMLDRSASALRGRAVCPDLMGPEVCEQLARVRDDRVELTFEASCRLGAEHDAWCQVRCIPFAAGIALVVRDLTAARRSEELYRSVIETSAAGIVVIDDRGLIDSVNPAAERLFGYTADELVGANVSLLMPEPYRSEHDGYLERYRAGGTAGVIGRGREVLGRTKDGASFALHLAVGEMIIAGRRMFTGIVSDLTERKRVEEELRRIELRSHMLAAQVVLRRVATAVARESDPTRVFDLVAEEVARHLGVSLGLVCRFDDDRGVIVGRWSSGAPITALTLPLSGGGALAQVARSEAPARVDDYARLVQDVIHPIAGSQFKASVAAPVFSPVGVWGAVLASTSHPEPLPAGAEHQLADFADLVAMAVANAADRARLVELAATDPLTGLANHRAFHERLRGEVQRAARHGRPLSLVMLDVDHFKRVNDTHGHGVGDEVLREIVRRLRAEAREGELIGRVGGEEFGWILPDTGIDGGREAAERARRAICESPFPTAGAITISAGVCDLTRAREVEQLVLFADGALYWAKRQGRNTVCDYEVGAVDALSSDEHLTRLERSQALASVRALARAVDAKDPSTREHSIRVADLAVRLATACGWTPDRIARLYEAGLLHDVGKIGIPDAILFKPGPLTSSEYEAITQHAELGQRIINGSVSAEQSTWVRHYHERFDGRGYPDGLAGTAIPDGARILALADACDVMTSPRPYREVPLSLVAALAECRRQKGRQFCPDAVEALERLWGAGALGEGPRSPTRFL